MVTGLPAKVAFKALNEYGKPADIRGQIYNESGELQTEFSSYHQGMGAFEFTPQPGEKYYAQLTEPAGIDLDYFLPEALDRGYSLQVVGQNNDQLQIGGTQYRNGSFDGDLTYPWRSIPSCYDSTI